MDRELLEKLQEEAKRVESNIDKLRDIERLMSEMDMNNGNNLSRLLQDISFDLNQALRIIGEGPETVSRDIYNAANFSVTNEMTKKEYVISSVVNLYIESMSQLVDVENAVNSGSIDYLEGMKRLKGIVQGIVPYSKNVPNINNVNLSEMASAFSSSVKDLYAKYEKELTPEQKKEVTLAQVESLKIKTDEGLETVIDENDRLQKEALDIKESSKNDSQFDSVATDILEKFKRLNSALENSSYGGTINFDPDDVMFALRGLQDSVFDLSAISNGRNNIHDTSYEKYLNDMSVVFSEKTNKTRSALSDFQLSTFESSIPQIRKLLEETKSRDEKSEILKKFTKSAAWYMHGALIVNGQNNSHVEDVIRDVNDIIKSANSIGLEHEQEALEHERKQTEYVRSEMRKQVNETIIEQLTASPLGTTMSKKDIEKMAEELTEETLNDSSVQRATAEAISEAVKIEDSVLTDSTQRINKIVENQVDKKVEKVVNNIVSEEITEVVENKNIQKNPIDTSIKLLRIDLDNTPVTKSKEEVTEDVQWTVIGSVVETMLSDNEKFKDIDTDIIESIKSTFKILTFDEGRVIDMSDGSQQRVQTVLRKSFLEGISSKDLFAQITTKSDELTDIAEKLEIVEQTLGHEFITETIQQFNSAQPHLVENITYNIMNDSQSREFSCENEYVKKISNQMQFGTGENLLENLFATNESSLTINSIYDQMHSRISQFQSSRILSTTTDLSQQIPVENEVFKSTPEQIIPSIHPLDRYRELLEKYDIQFIADDNFPEGRFVALDRLTSQSPQYSSKEERDTLIRDLSFAKSWVASCGVDLSKTGTTNEYGIDPRQWEYSFNEGAKSTYNLIIEAIQNNNGQNLRQQIIEHVGQNSDYKYADSIVEALLRDRNNKELLNNIHNALLNDAGHSIEHVIDEHELGL